MAVRRFVAPARDVVPAACWQAPVFSEFDAYQRWFSDLSWPTCAQLGAPLSGRCHAYSGAVLSIVEQTADLLLDGHHYEQRIFERGGIATRRDNWHDLFNAVIWASQSGLKSAVNARQYADLQAVGHRERTRGQCALTQFDEAGAVVLVREPALLALWDGHDWSGLFWQARSAWHDGAIEVGVFGHALLEHALNPGLLLVGKCLVLNDRDADLQQARERVAAAIVAGEVLQDPQELRPLPLSGIPGWHPRTGEPTFYQDAPCFRPVRPGRRYPLALA